MTSDHFFVTKASVKGPEVILDGAEHHHLSRVVRIHRGMTIHLFDEDGTKYRARVEDIEPRSTRLILLETEPRSESAAKIVLAPSLLKAKAMDVLVQMAAELGISAIRPVLSVRSVIKIEGQVGRKRERWTKIARAAAKQSRSGSIPEFSDPQPLAALLREASGGLKIFLSEHGGRRLRDLAEEGLRRTPREAVLLLGPEGGWTAAEEELIKAHGFEAASLGRSILRAETAAFAAAAILTHFWSS